MKKNKKRVAIVLIFLILFAIYLFVTIKGNYLQTLEIGNNFKTIFEQKLKYKINVVLVNFIFLYISTYIVTKITKKGLKKFFDAEKKEMPKLPTKSICLMLSVIISIITGNLLTEKIISAINGTYFGKLDPVFNLDIGYYIFQKPLIETIIIYFIGLMVVYSIYITAYYIIAFNRFFDKGVDREILKNGLFLKQIIANVIIIAILGAFLILAKTQNVVYSKFINISDGTSLYGAGIIETGVKTWGYRIFAIVVPVCIIFASRNLKKGSFKKIAVWLSIIPTYLVILFLVMVGTNLLYVRRNELDKQKYYIERNIEFTKNAYNINIDEIEVENEGPITIDNIENNTDVIKNINLLNKNAILLSLKQYESNLGYYTYNTAKEGLYGIDGEDTLVYISPREILSNETRTYNNKTYGYTHGYGIIATNANKVNENGGLEYIQKDFEGNNSIKINEPRIYFGMQTNEYIITNTKKQEEFDYPLTKTTNSSNVYNGTAGLKLNFLDRLVLGIKEKNIKLAFSGGITSNSKIITTRNVRERAKSIMPYLMYDEEPYMIVTDDGNLVWVVDAYTTSNNYPYSEQTIIEYEGMKKKINYIRNSAKVIIDAYNGETKFYLTDRTDPIIMEYNKMYPGLFEENLLPESISNHIVYSKYLYNVQAQVLQKYHDVQAEVLYRGDDIWNIAKENTTKNTSGGVTGTPIEAYYTVVKNVDNENAKLGLVIPYTIANRQNLVSYLIGEYDSATNNQKLTIYRFKTTNTILGTNQLDTLVEQDEKIQKEIESINSSGTKITKNIIVIPIDNKLLYVEPIYQTMLNEEIQVPVLKKVLVASGNKIAIGNNLKEAIDNLLSQEAVSIEVNSENKDELIDQIINANNNLIVSNESNNWELIGKDIGKLQELVKELEIIVNREKEQEAKYGPSEETEENEVYSENN